MAQGKHFKKSNRTVQKIFDLRTFKPPSNLTCIFLSVRVNLKETFQCQTPCMILKFYELLNDLSVSDASDGEKQYQVKTNCKTCSIQLVKTSMIWIYSFGTGCWIR